MAIRRAFVIGAPIVLVAVAIGVVSQQRSHRDVHVSVIHKEAPMSVPAPPAVDGAFVSLTRIRDDEIASKGFTLPKQVDVRVYAVGEGTGNEMHDFGWIMNASTREPVWRMRYRDTERAGGATKNRMVNEVISLDAGNYIVYYMTDGSHSWDDWNSSPPRHEDAWGITLSPADGNVDLELVSEYDVGSDPNIVAQLITIRDDADRSKGFTLDNETELRIYALGEGDDGEMYDYAWIEDANSGRGLWEMTYRLTEHAGGARKNRMYDANITLPAGEYVLRYRADDSHSLESWNLTPPNDPFSYGVTLLRVEN
jgi:hypothetical protein